MTGQKFISKFSKFIRGLLRHLSILASLPNHYRSGFGYKCGLFVQSVAAEFASDVNSQQTGPRFSALSRQKF